MFEWHMDWKEPEPRLDRDRVVTLTVGQLTDALAEALKVVKEVPAGAKWKRGDRAYIEVELTGFHGTDNAHTSCRLIDADPTKTRNDIGVPVSALIEKGAA